MLIDLNTTRNEIIEIIYSVIDEMNQLSPEKIPIEKSLDATLFGVKGQLDSLSFVTLIVNVEQKVEDELGVIITLSDERALSQENTPFKNVDSLSNYIVELLEER